MLTLYCGGGLVTPKRGSASISDGRIWQSLTVIRRRRTEAGVQELARLRRSMDSGLRRNDEYVAEILPKRAVSSSRQGKMRCLDKHSVIARPC